MTPTLSLTLALLLSAAPARADQLVSGTKLRVYYDSTGHWNDASAGYGLQVNHSGAWVDYSYPGTPYAMWSLEFQTTSSSYAYYTHYSYGSTMSSVVESDDSTSTDAIATYTQVAGPLSVVKRETWALDSGSMLVELEVTNDGTDTVSNIRWLQTVDPDQDYTTYSTYNTYDDVRDVDGSGTNDWVESRGATSGRTLAFGACDETISEMGHFGSWSSVVDADQTLTDYGGSSYDYAMGMRVAPTSSLAAGETLTMSFVVIVADDATTARALYPDALTSLCDQCDSDDDGYDSLDCGGTDCDDTDASVYPGADEYCNSVDDDCDGSIDEDALDMTWFYDDDDSDSYGDPDDRREACDAPTGYVTNNDDCDDRDPDVNPAGIEVCNDTDDDCDGYIDEGATDAGTWYADSDGDSYGSTDAATSCDAPAGYVADNTDCDDSNSAVNPGATEICNGIDDDCNGIIDTDAADRLTWYADTDSDAYGNPDVSVESCEEVSGYVTDNTDCDDSVGAVNPGATEVCNGIDDDCDTIIDTDAVDMGTWYVDSDGDLYGDPAVSTEGCDQPDGSVADNTDCDDDNAAINPGEMEIPYDGLDNDCSDGDLTDVDGDGYDCDCVDGGTDCDDTDADTWPGATEVGDGVDQDCDGVVDDGTDWYDDDGDGFAESGGDCDDSDDSVHPGASETADGIDEDCDGIIDEGTTAYDDDGDGWTEDEGDCNDADAAVSPDQTEVEANGIDDDCDGVVDDGAYDADGDGYTVAGGDCDDSSDAVLPGGTEVADGLDNDCDGEIDEGTSASDDDGDGWTEDQGDCDDTNSSTNPDADELSDNGMDDDCDGTVDEDSDLTDDDGDGFSEAGGDCDDGDIAVNPSEEEITGNGIDDDCDGEIDEGSSDDADADGITPASGDCDDSDPWAFPGATEFCDGVDNDCDGTIDEDCDVVELAGTATKGPGCGGCSALPGTNSRGLAAALALLMGLVGLRRRRRRQMGSPGGGRL